MQKIKSLIILSLLTLNTHADWYLKYNFEFYSEKFNINLLKNNPNEYQTRKEFQERINYSMKNLEPAVVTVNLLGKNDRKSHCTGTLIKNKYVITAKHCLQMDWVKDIIITPDKLVQDSLPEDKKYSSVARVIGIIDTCSQGGWCYLTQQSFTIPPVYETYEDEYAGEDLVILELDRNIGTTLRNFELPSPQDILPEKNLIMNGYPGFLAKIANRPFQFQTKEECRVVGQYKNSIYTNCAPSGGISGGPLYTKENGKNIIWGVLSSQIGPFNASGERDLENKVYNGSKFASTINRDVIELLNTLD